MTIYKNCKKEREFAQISNSLIGDPNLSAKAKGILIYLISKPIDWEVRFSDIKKHMKDGETAIRSGLRELEKAGYIKRGIERTDDGKFSEWIWNVYEKPLKPENRTNPEDRKFKRKGQEPRGITAPDGENPKVDNPELDNPQPTNTDSTNTEVNNTELKEGEEKTSPSDEEILAQMKQAEQEVETKGTAHNYKERLKQSNPKPFTPNEQVKELANNLYDYPPEVQNTIKAFARLWDILPPPKGTSKFTKWIKYAKEIKDLCGDIPTDVVLKEVYRDWKGEHGEGKFDVYDIGSINNVVWPAVTRLVTGKGRNVKTYIDADGNPVEMER
jgi:hypothetical protein